MKKILLSFSCLFLFLLFFLPPDVFAQSCETQAVLCNNLPEDSCKSPCVRVITRQGGPGGRAGRTRALCACKMPKSGSSVPVGGLCYKDEDCAHPGKYCWGEFSQLRTCHEISRAEALRQRQGPTPIDPTCKNKGQPNSINTALGCIPASDLNEFIKWILGKLIFVASGIAFLLMAFGALQILTSAGNPEKIKAGSELITSALSGLLFIILSLFLLKLIGVDILHIPGFGT